jgi:hypothetical protein
MNHIAYSLLEQTTHQQITRDTDFDTDIQRLEHKLNLVIQMLGQLMQTEQSRPEPHKLRLAAETIAWQYPSAQIGQRYIITLFLYDSIAVPIQALVEVIDVTSEWCTARFVSQATDEQSAWERWVFSQHRRQVAQNREHVSHAK